MHHYSKTDWSVGKHCLSKIQSTAGHLLQSQRLLQFLLLTNSVPSHAAVSWFRLPVLEVGLCLPPSGLLQLMIFMFFMNHQFIKK